jgi:hypothetical protein
VPGSTLVPLNVVAILQRLERDHADLLAKHGMRHLDMGQSHSGNRIVTQTIVRSLYDQGAAGVIFGSQLDDQPCLALFEGRARLETDGSPIPLTDDIPALMQVCDAYKLPLET